MILTHSEILKQIDEGNIVIDPPPEYIGPNSVDLRLGDRLLVYDSGLFALFDQLGEVKTSAALGITREHVQYTEDLFTRAELAGVEPGSYISQQSLLSTRADAAPKVHELKIGEQGIVLSAGVLYLGHTLESTYTPKHVPEVDGRSSIARLGMSVHVTAGKGEIGWRGQWTLEITVVHPLRIFAGDRVAQIWMYVPQGELTEYDGRYVGSVGPVASRMHEQRK